MNFLVIVFGYVTFHGLTSVAVAPIQNVFLPEITAFASLVYLPHGVRVLATWAFGWKAVPALIVGTTLSAWLFSASADWSLFEPPVIYGVIGGSLAALFAFELLRLMGLNFYLEGSRELRWQGMIAVGAIASILNSLFQTVAYFEDFDQDRVVEFWSIYLVGDIVGLVSCMVVLMFVFRWSRAFSGKES